MVGGLIRLVLQGVAVFAASYLIPGIYLADFWHALLVALILSVVNVTVKPVLQLLTFPITFLTLGFFLLVINALMVMLVDYFVKGFSVGGFLNALFFSIVISVIYWILDGIFGDKKNKK